MPNEKFLTGVHPKIYLSHAHAWEKVSPASAHPEKGSAGPHVLGKNLHQAAEKKRLGPTDLTD